MSVIPRASVEHRGDVRVGQRLGSVKRSLAPQQLDEDGALDLTSHGRVAKFDVPGIEKILQSQSSLWPLPFGPLLGILCAFEGGGDQGLSYKALARPAKTRTMPAVVLTMLREGMR